MDAPREDLVRMSTSLRHEEDGTVMTGYAAVWNEWTEIDSWEGRFKERIAPGAFKKTLKERADQIQVLFNHGMDPQIGDKPLGRPRVMREDDVGLYVEVPLDDTSYNQDIKALLRSGALRGMSFRMTIPSGGDEWEFPDAKRKDALPERTIRQIKLYEFGPVTFPAYAATQAGVRAHAPRAFEAWRTANPAPVIPSAEEEVEERDEDVSADQPVTDTEVQESEPVEATRSDESGPVDTTRDDEDEPSESTTPTRSLTLAQIRRTAELTASYVEAIRIRSERYDL